MGVCASYMFTYVYPEDGLVCGTARPIRTRACAVATAGPAKPVTHAAPRHQHQSSGHRLQHQTGSLRVSFGREHHPPTAVPLRALHPTSILSAFLFFSALLSFLSLFPSLRLFLSFSPPSPLSSPCANHRDMHDHQTALTAEVTHPSTRRCLPMDSWKTDWDFLETILRDLLAL